MEIFSRKYDPMRMGGNLITYTKTEAEPEEVINIGGWDIAIIRNPCVEAYHACLVECGAMIGTGLNSKIVVDQVTEDINIGDQKVMEKQVKEGEELLKGATLEDAETFFSKFKGVVRRTSV